MLEDSIDATEFILSVVEELEFLERLENNPASNPLIAKILEETAGLIAGELAEPFGLADFIKDQKETTSILEMDLLDTVSWVTVSLSYSEKHKLKPETYEGLYEIAFKSLLKKLTSATGLFYNSSYELKYNFGRIYVFRKSSTSPSKKRR